MGWYSPHQAQSFETIPLNSFPSYQSPIHAVADINQDGQAELFLSGKTANCGWDAALYTYTNGDFIRIPYHFIPLANGEACFLDFDLDGDLDLLYTGIDSTLTEQFYLYRNSGQVFLVDNSFNFPALNFCRLKPADFNLDGQEDLLYAGIDQNGLFSINLWYSHDQKWVSSYSELPAICPGEYLCTDLDRDGMVDIFMGGRKKNGSIINAIYINQKNGKRFTQDSRFISPDLVFTCLRSADADNDGDEDIVFSGYQVGHQPISGIFYNRPTGTLDPNYQVLGEIQGDLITTDFNLDGNIDILISGLNRDLMPETRLITQLGQTNHTESTIINSIQGLLLNEDFNSDRRPDWLILGNDSIPTFTASLMLNLSSPSNQGPEFTQAIPSPRVLTDRIIFEIPPGTDDHTPSLALRYQFQLGTASNPDGYLSALNADPLSSSITSLRGQSRLITLEPGEYLWRVRIMDNSQVFSAWSPPVPFTVSQYIPAGYDMIGLTKGRIITADFNQDGWQDIGVNGFNTLQQPYCAIYLNTTGTFTSLQDYSSWSGTGYGAIYPYDLNLDLYPDLFMTGSEKNTQTSAQGLTRGYLNQIPQWNAFTPIIHSGDSIVTQFPNLIESDIKLTHLDQDTHPEIILCGGENRGLNNIPPRIFIYTYHGETSFTQWPDLTIPGYRYGSLECGDMNNDGLTDIIINGLTFSASGSNQLTAHSTIFIQRPDHSFPPIDSSIDLQGLHVAASVKLADLDNDQDLDIVMCGGNDDYSKAFTLIYQNNYPNFTLVQQLPGVFAGDIAIGDIDHNTEPDLFINGWSPDSSRAISCLYLQINGIFTSSPIPAITDLYWSAASLADFDQDGNLDLVQAGIDSMEVPQLTVYRNSFFKSGTSWPLPSEPSILESVISRDTVNFTWTPGTDGRNHSTQGLSYQLLIKNSINQPVYVSNILYGTPRLTIYGLADGNYTAEIRSRDNAHRYSPHQRISSFYIDTSPPLITGVEMPSLAGIGRLNVKIYFLDPSFLDSSDYPNLYLLQPGQDSLVLTITTLSQNLIIATADIPVDQKNGDYTIWINQISDRRHNTQSTPQWIGQIRLDTEQSRLITSIPLNMQTRVSTLTPIRLGFSRKILSTSLNQERFTLTNLTTNQNVVGQLFLSIADSLSLLTFQPTERLNFMTPFRIKASALITDTLGNPLLQDYIIQFTTGSLIKPDSGAIIYSSDSSMSLYIPPFALNAEEEISFELLESVDPANSGSVSQKPEFYLHPLLQFLNPSTLKWYKPESLWQNQGVSHRFEFFDSLQNQWMNTGGYETHTELSAPLIQTGRYRINGLADTLPAQIISGDHFVLNPRVFNPDNPEKPGLDISFALHNVATIQLKIFNSAGELVIILKDNESLPAGNYTITWDGNGIDHHKVLDGLYIAVLRTGQTVSKKTLAVLRK